MQSLPDGTSANLWRSLMYFNGYRLAVAVALLFTTSFVEQSLLLGAWDRRMFVAACVLYGLFAGFAFAPLVARQPRFQVQLPAHVGADVLFVVLIMHASGGISSGMGLLLLANLAAAGIISRGRITLFFAALASLAVLAEHTYEVLFAQAGTALYLQAGLQCIGYFATAWLAHSLAARATASERLAAQREVDLESMEQVSRLVMQGMQDGVVVVDGSGMVRQMNPRAEEFLGALPGGRAVLLQDHSPALAERLARWRLDPEQGLDPMQTVMIRQVAAARFVPVGRGEPPGVVIFLEDLTRIQLQAQQMKLVSLGRLTANIAHEIRNPLSAINHAAELLQEDRPDGTHGRLLRIITDNSRRLDRMVQDVLRLNRRDRAVREVVDLGDFLQQFATQFCEIEKVETTVVRVEVNAPVRVSFDRSHLNQVMWNLCRNALRYCRRQPGSVRVAVDPGRGPDTVHLSVTDDGPGVSEASRAHLFEPFFTTAPSGTGLGLYLARETCEANGASLSYVEGGPGARFTVVIRCI